jgi:hypothetical protein
MAYTTRFSGEIRIDPPIPAEEVAGTGFFHEGHRTASKDVRLKVVEVPVDGVPGAYRREAVAIVGLEGGFSCYDAVPHVQEIVNRWGAGRTFTGRLDAAGEEAGDVWRLLVRDGRAVEVRPQLVWPDDPEG